MLCIRKNRYLVFQPGAEHHMSQHSTIYEAVKGVTEESLNRIRRHPFITTAAQGKLTYAQAIRWIKCAGRESRSFPHILENMIAFTTNAAVKEILHENLDDEYGNGNPEHAHFKHYLHLIDNLGIPRSDFFEYKEGAGIRLALSLAYNVSRANDAGLALGYMLVNEGMTPVTYGAARAALMPLCPDLKTTFFDMHITVDIHHVEELYRALDHMPTDQIDSILYGVLVGERGMASLLDEAFGLFDHCPEIPVYQAAE
jgi:pyrroloquinoline quinone (PQQ) biosynthesis protein C